MCLERLLEDKGRLLLYASANEILPTTSGGSVDVDTWIHFEHGSTVVGSRNHARCSPRVSSGIANRAVSLDSRPVEIA